MPLSTKDATKQIKTVTHDLYLVADNDLLSMAGYIRGFLDKQEGGILALFSLDDYMSELLMNPRWHIWVAIDNGKIEGVLPVCFVEMTDYTYLHVLAVNCINLKKYISQGWKIEKWAFERGAIEIQFDGSPAFDRLFRKSGYEVKAVKFAKPLIKMWGH